MKKSLLASSSGASALKRSAFLSASSCGATPERVRRVGDRLAVLVGARQEEHLLAALAVVARHHVGGDRRVGVPQVRRRVDVVDRGGHVEGHAAPRLLSRGACAALARQLAVELVGAAPPSASPRPPPPGAPARPPSTSSRSASSASSRDAALGAARADHEHDLAARGVGLVVLGQLAARCRAGLPRGASSARGTPPPGAAGRASASSRSVPARRRGDSNATSVSPALRQQLLELGALARQEADEEPALGRQAGGDERGHDGARPGQHLDRKPSARHARTSAKPGIGDQRRARVGDERHDLARPRCAPRAPVARARSLCSCRLTSGALDLDGGRAARACAACPRTRPRRPAPSTASTRSVTSSRLPIGVGQTTQPPDCHLRGSHPANIGSARCAPSPSSRRSTRATARAGACCPGARERAGRHRRVCRRPAARAAAPAPSRPRERWLAARITAQTRRARPARPDRRLARCCRSCCSW